MVFIMASESQIGQMEEWLTFLWALRPNLVSYIASKAIVFYVTSQSMAWYLQSTENADRQARLYSGSLIRQNTEHWAERLHLTSENNFGQK